MSAVVVEWLGLKPCWKLCCGMNWRIEFRISFSSSFEIVDKRESGRYEEGFDGFLPGFSLGMIIAFFHWGGYS